MEKSTSAVVITVATAAKLWILLQPLYRLATVATITAVGDSLKSVRPEGGVKFYEGKPAIMCE